MKSLQELADKYAMLGYYLIALRGESKEEFLRFQASAAEGFIDGLEAAGVISGVEQLSLIKEVREIREEAIRALDSEEGVQS